jgi:hypothetical protein
VSVNRDKKLLAKRLTVTCLQWQHDQVSYFVAKRFVRGRIWVVDMGLIDSYVCDTLESEISKGSLIFHLALWTSNFLKFNYYKYTQYQHYFISPFVQIIAETEILNNSYTDY